MINVFFGDSQRALLLDEDLSVTSHEAIYKAPFKYLQPQFGFKAVVLLNQLHGTQGFLITPHTPFDLVKLRQHSGDFLTTNVSNVALGVLTADCLPIIFYDERNKAIGIAHAGWRGSVEAIVEVTLSQMKDYYGTSKKGLQVFFGPSAKQCCYEVDEPFIKNLSDDSFAGRALMRRDSKWYFDLPGYNAIRLKAFGIPANALHFTDNHCTICTPDYCSYRGQNGTRRRNVSLVSLK